MALGDILTVGQGTGRVYRYSNGSWDSGLEAPSGVSPAGVAVDPENGDILIAGLGTSRVYRYSNGSWDSGLEAPSGASVSGVAVDPNNGDIVIASFATIYRHNGTSWDSGLAGPTGESAVIGVGFDLTNDDLLAAGSGQDRVYRYSNGSWDAGLAGPTGETSVSGVTTDFDGDILVAGNTRDRIYRHDGSAWDSGLVGPAGETVIVGVGFDAYDPSPSFADDTGDAISGTVGTAITSVTVPEADGEPAPTYAVVGTLPAGLAFNATTRVLSGTPTAAGTGTITIRATNSEGAADWTVDYAFTNLAPVVSINLPPLPIHPITGLRTVLGDSTIQLGSTISDDSGGTLTILWSSPQGTFSDTAIGNPTWAAPDVNADANVQLTLRVEDRFGLATTVNVSVTVEPPLRTSDWDGTGYRQPPIALAVMDVTVNGADITMDPVTPTSGELVIGPNLTIDGLERHGTDTGRLIRLRREGEGNFSDYFGSSGAFPTAEIFIVLRDASDNPRTLSFTHSNSGGGFSNWDADDADAPSLINALVTGNQIVFAVAEPAVANAVDAGDIDATAALSEPGTTHAGATFDYTVDAAAIAVATVLSMPAVNVAHRENAQGVDATAVLSQPAVTLTAHVPDMHRVIPQDIRVTSALSQPTVLKRKLADAGDVTATATLSQPTVRRVMPTTDHRVIPQDVDASAALSEPTVTHRRPALSLDLGTPDAFAAGNWVQWDERTVGYGDLSLLSDPPGEPRALIRLRLFRNGNVQFQTIDTPDGTSGFASREDLSEDWEQNATNAVIVHADGVTPDLLVTGPDANGAGDDAEPYQWANDNAAAQQTWFDAYESAGRPRVSIGVRTPGIPRWLASGGAIAASGALSQPTVAVAGASEVLAGDIASVAALSEPTVTHAGPPLALPDPADIVSDFLEVVDVTLPAASGGTPPYVYSTSPLPIQIQFDADTRELSEAGLAVGDHDVAYTVTDDAGASVTQAFTITIRAVRPAAPSLVVLTLVSPTSVFGQITAPTVPPRNGGVPLTHYRVDVSVDGGAFVTHDASVPVGGAFTQDGLIPGSTYTYRAYAANSVGESVGFAEASATAPLSLAANAGDVDATAALSQPTVTVPRAMTHAVAAGDVDASATLSQPTATFTGALSLAVDAGDVDAGAALSEPAVARTAALSHAVDAGDVDARAALSEPAVTHVGVVSYARDAGNIDAAGALSRPAVTTTRALAAPSFTPATGDTIRGFVGADIDDVMVPSAEGNPTPTYAVVGNLPPGVAFDVASRVLRFASNLVTAGSGTIRIRATNSQGTADWTVAFDFSAQTAEAPSPPLFPRLERGEGSTLVLAWEPPLSDGGGTITAYEAMICDEADQNCGWETVWTDDD